MCMGVSQDMAECEIRFGTSSCMFILFTVLQKNKGGDDFMNQAISTQKAPAAIGPYSQGIRSGNTVYVSGQLPIDPATGAFVSEDVSEQTRQSLTNVQSILKEAGMDMGDVVSVTVYLSDIADFAAMNEVYATFFRAPYPARAAIQVAAIPKGARVEIGAIASK